MSKRVTRLAGHGLRNEGRLYADPLTGYSASVAGPAVCERGEKSGSLPNASQRKRWHAEHKESVRAYRAGVVK